MQILPSMACAALALLWVGGSAETEVPVGIVPCTNTSAQRWQMVTQLIDGANATNMDLVSLPQGDTDQHTISCPGTTTSSGGSSACHLWGSGLDFTSDRNDVFTIVGTNGAFQVHSWPATASVPTADGKVNPGMCLVADTASAALVQSVSMQPVGSSCLKFTRRHDGALAVLGSGSAGMCLGTPPPPDPPCWFANSSVHRAPMCDPTLAPAVRARDLVSRMTLKEKGENLGGDGGWGGSAGVPRLGATASCLAGQKTTMMGSSEALHGLVQASCGEQTYWAEFGGNNTGCAASFPHALALGGTFNRSLWAAVGDRISTEARATYNIGKMQALWLWAPNINLFHDPRWGRGQETAGEDPFLAGEYATRFIHAFQYGIDGGAGATTQLKALPSAKHAMGYNLEDWNGLLDRASFNAIISDRDQVQYYYPAWRAAIEGGRVGTVMCSYNAVNGVPSCANGAFLNGVLRDAYGFDGIVTSDCGAINNLQNSFKPGTNGTGTMEPGFPTADADHAMLAGISNGCDMDCPGGAKPTQYFDGVSKAVADGVLPIEMVDRSIERMLTGAISLGLLDDPAKSPYAHLADADLDTPATRRLNLESAIQAMVLLKNEPPAKGSKPVLPIAKGARIALLGPHFNSTQDLLSNYCPGHYSNIVRSPLMAAQTLANAGIVELAGYARGCDLVGDSTQGFAAAVALAKSVDVPIVFLGLSPGTNTSAGVTPRTSSAHEGEGSDRTDIDLTGQQEALAAALVAANPSTVVVLVHGGSIDIAKPKSYASAILDAHYPGQQGGDAIMHTLLNHEGAAPAGRLATTVYPQAFTARPMSDMSLNNITYKHYTGAAVFPFGYGMSYSMFDVQWLNESAAHQRSTTAALRASHATHHEARGVGADWVAPARYSAMVTNRGAFTSDFVLLGFVSASDERRRADPGEPIRELFDFARVASVAPGASVPVHLTISPSVLSHVDASGTERLQAGQYKIELGGQRLGGQVADAVGSLEVVGEDQVLFSFSKTSFN